jgi:putative membrane protein
MATFISIKRWPHAATAALGTVLVAGLTQAALADGQHTGENSHHMWEDGMSLMFMGPLMMIVLLAVVVVIAVLVVRWLSPGSASTGRGASSARAILDERFARGEIEAEDYRARCAELDN